MAATSSASRPPSPAARRTSRSNWRATRKRPTRSSRRWACPCRSRNWCRPKARRPARARRIGYPVVTKPYNGNHGRGISIKLTTEDEVAQGFRVAKEHSRSVIVETYLEGDDHRLLVVNGELVAATRRTPGHVVGDGVKNIVDLIEVVNQDPRRGVGHEKVLTRLELDGQAQKMLEKARADRGIDARHRAKSSTCAPPRTCRRAAPRPTSPTSSIPTIATWPCAPCRPWASTSAASTSCRPTSPRATARSAAASAK